MSYETFIMLPTTTPVTLVEIEARLKNLFANPVKNRTDLQIEHYNDSLELKFKDCSFYIGLSAEPHVLLEAQEIAERFPDREFVGEYGKRIEISADDDPNMDYFNDFAYIVEELEKVEGAIAYQHRIGEFI